MKKLIACTTAAALVVSLGACGAKNAAPAISAESSAQVQMVNPWRDVDETEAMEALGLPLSAPAEAEGVSYRLMETDAEKMVEMDFELEGISYFLRVQEASSAEAYDMSGLAYEWDYEDTEPVGYCEGTLRLCSEAGCLFWQDVVPGINYTLGAEQAVTIRDMAATAEQCFFFTSADSFAMRWIAPNLTGIYTAENDSHAYIDLMDGDVYLTNFWLNNNEVELSGSGTVLDGSAIEMMLETEAGEKMTAVFYPENDIYVFAVTESELPQMETGASIEFTFDEKATAAMYNEIETPEVLGVFERVEKLDDAAEYLVFNADGTGWCSVQDDISMQWDDACISLDSGEVYEYSVTWEDVENFSVVLYLEQDKDGMWLGTEFKHVTEYPEYIAALLQ